jgi:hypothetical protein
VYRCSYCSRSVGVRIAVEVVGTGAAEALRSLSGVRSVEAHDAGGRTRATVMTIGERGIRADVFELAKARGWVLYELHQESRTL